MGLTEGTRRIYGTTANMASGAGSWYDQFYRRPWESVEKQRARAEKQASAYSLPDPSSMRSPSRGLPDHLTGGLMSRGVQPARKAGRTTTTRGQQVLDYSNPAFARALQDAQQRVAASGVDEMTGLPNYYSTASAPGSYQMAQSARQEAQGLYTEVHAMDPGNWSPPELKKLQRQMVQAGLLTEKFHLGVFDNQTQAAYSSLLQMANTNGGKTKGEMLSQLIATNPDDLMSAYRKPDFVKPDRATLVEDVENVMKQRLGREPTADERKMLAKRYMQEFRREYRLETEPGARAEFYGSLGDGLNDAERTIGMTGRTPDLPTVKDVDPGQSFANFFRKYYKHEEREIGRREERAEQQATAQQGFEQLRSMMGTGGVQQLGA